MKPRDSYQMVCTFGAWLPHIALAPISGVVQSNASAFEIRTTCGRHARRMRACPFLLRIRV
jgi:hypothetical protein